MKITYKIRLTPKDWDSNTLIFYKDGVKAGSGYQDKEDKRLKIQLCPKCQRENYIMTVVSGKCAWCGLDSKTFEEESVKK